MVKVKRGVKVSRPKTLSQRSKTLSQRSKEEKEFRKYLEKIEREDYPWVAKDLPENPTSLERAKYEICQKILGYQEDNNLSDKELSHRLGINEEKTLQILFCWIEKFTLDKLIIYTNKLLAPTQIQVVIRETRFHSPKTKPLHARTV